MLTIPKYIDPFQISLPNSRFTHLFSYWTVDPDILRDISSHMSTSELLTFPYKPFLPAAFPSFQLMAAPFFQVFSPKNPGVFLHMTFSLNLHPISGHPTDSSQNMFKFCFSLFPLHFLSSKPPLPSPGLLPGPPDWASRYTVFHMLSQHNSWVELLKLK